MLQCPNTFNELPALQCFAVNICAKRAEYQKANMTVGFFINTYIQIFSFFLLKILFYNSSFIPVWQIYGPKNSQSLYVTIFIF